MNSEEKHNYITALDKAIEAFTENECLKNPEAFVYSNVNLRYAVERQLYFDYCSYDSFIVAFINKKELIARNKLDYLLAKNLNIKIKLDHSFFKYLKKNLYFLYCLFSDLLMNVSEKYITIKNPTEPIDLLFYVEQKKNIEYFSSFIKYLNKKYLFLSNHYLGLSDNDCKFLTEYTSKYKILSKNKRKHTLKLFPALVSEFDEILKSLKHLSPKLVVLPEGNSSRCELLNQACKLLDIKAICVQYGWSPIVHVGFRNMSYDVMLIWGAGFQKILQPYNPAQSFHVVGNPNLNFVSESPAIRKEKVWTFFLPNNRQHIRTDRIITSKELEDFYSLIKWVAKKFKNTKIYIRNHPSAQLSNEEKEFLSSANVYFCSTENLTLKNILEKTNLAVTFHSTIILECVAYSIPVLIYRPDSSYHFNPDVRYLEIIKEAYNLEEAKEIFLKGIQIDTNTKKLKEEVKNFRNEYFYSGVKKPEENISFFLNSQL